MLKITTNDASLRCARPKVPWKQWTVLNLQCVWSWLSYSVATKRSKRSWPNFRGSTIISEYDLILLSPKVHLRPLQRFASTFQRTPFCILCCYNILGLDMWSMSEFPSVCLCVYICVCKQEGGNTSQPSAARTGAAKEAETHPHHRSSVLIWGPQKSQVSITQPISAGWLKSNLPW